MTITEDYNTKAKANYISRQFNTKLSKLSVQP